MAKSCSSSIDWHFNPLTPCGVRPNPDYCDVLIFEISIHSPRVG